MIPTDVVDETLVQRQQRRRNLQKKTSEVPPEIRRESRRKDS